MNSANFVALILTIVIEFLVIWIALRQTPKKLLFYSILINCFTLPLAIFADQEIKYLYYNYAADNQQLFYFSDIVMLIVEITVISVESVLWWKLLNINFSKALLIAFAANAISAIIGLFIF